MQSKSFLIEGGATLSGAVTPSGNKNEILPILCGTLLTHGDIVLKNVPRIEDVNTLLEILKGLGKTYEWDQDSLLIRQNKNAAMQFGHFDLCTKIRASILLLGPLLALKQSFSIPLPGGDVIGARRIDTHWEGLQTLGATLQLEKGSIAAESTGLQGQKFFLDEPSVTATENLILAASLAKGKTILFNAACEPHVKGLCLFLQKMGANISGIGTNKLVIEGQDSLLKGCEYTVQPDFMEIGSFLALGASTHGSIRIENYGELEDLQFILKQFGKIGIRPKISQEALTVDMDPQFEIAKEISGRIASIASAPWPGFPTDLMSVAIVAATQAKGTLIFFEKMFEGRMFFTDKLLSMGANIVLCDPHRVVVNGPSPLYASRLSSPDVRAGMALVIAALCAKGQSQIDNIYQVERGYAQIEKKLLSLGAKIRTL